MTKTIQIVNLLTQMLINAAIGWCVLAALWQLIFIVEMVNPVYYIVISRDCQLPLPVHLVGMLLPLLSARIGIRGASSYVAKITYINRVAWPVILLLPGLIFFKSTYWMLLLALLVAGIIVFRVTLVIKGERFKPYCRILPRNGMLIALIVFAISVAWGYYMQVRAFRVLYLLYQDWGEYASGYLQLASWEHVKIIDFFVNAGHWNPLANIVMTSAVWVYPAATTIFLINAVLISSSIPLAYCLARVFRLPVIPALLIGLLAMLNPVFSNQYLALFYGFHPIYFFIPVLFGFFIFERSQKRIWMMAMFVLSLFIQETVLIFWVGYAFYLIFFCRRYLVGAVLLVFSAGLFMLISSFIIPFAYRHEHYAQMFHYAHLGNSVLAAAFSFITKPDIFWGTFFAKSNLLFAAALLLPFCPAVLFKPKILIAVVPLFIGICLQSSRSLQNVAMQYGIEITVIGFVAMVAAVASSGKLKHTRLLKILAFNLTENTGRRIFWSLLCAALVTGAGSYLCFGKSAVIGKNSFSAIDKLPDCTAAIATIKKIIPAGALVQTQFRLRGHFVFDYHTGPICGDESREHYVVFNLFDNFEDNTAKIHRRLVADNRYAPLYSINVGDEFLLVFKFTPRTALPHQLPRFISAPTDNAMPTSGSIVKSADPNFELRIQCDTEKNVVHGSLKLLHLVDYDTNIKLHFVGNIIHSQIIPFGYGVFPAYLMRPGQIFSFTVPLPPEMTSIKYISIKLEPRK